MSRHNARIGWGVGFIFVGLLGLVLGRMYGESQEDFDFWCDGESAHHVLINKHDAWLTARFRLSFNPELSHMSMVSRLIDADTGAVIGTQHRKSAFHIQLKGDRLQVSVTRGAKGEAGTAESELSDALGMFIFQSESILNYWIRPLVGDRYVIDDGNDTFILCSRETSPLASTPLGLTNDGT